jgi:hypothetical protein
MFDTQRLEFIGDINTSEVLKRNDELEEEVKKLRKIANGKILLVEDGSVDIDRLEEDGFYVIPYRKGATPPAWLKSNNN